MAPKKATTATKSSSKGTSAHGSYKDMIKTAIVTLKDRTGSSRQAIKKYIQANNSLGSTSDASLSSHINHAITAGVKSGDFVQPKGPSGTVKLAKKGAAGPSAAVVTAIATTKAPKVKPVNTTAKKTTTAKKPPTAKKAPAAKKTSAAKSTTAKKPAAASKTKANTAKPRKTPQTKAPKAAPAVELKKPVVLGKTKSGRVTKSTAPPQTKKAIAPSKKTAKAGKKAATPKKPVAKAA